MDDELPSCDVCFRTDLELLACSKCHVAKYCGIPHQKLVWYTHKHICDLIEVGDKSLVYGAQCELVQDELRYINIDLVKGRVIVKAFDTACTNSELARRQLASLRALDSITTAAPISRATTLAKARFLFMQEEGGSLCFAIRKEQKNLSPFYYISSIMDLMKEQNIKLPSNSQFMSTFLLFWTILISNIASLKKDRNKYGTPMVNAASETLRRIKASIEFFTPVFVHLEGLLDQFKNDGGDIKVWKFLTRQKMACKLHAKNFEGTVKVATGEWSRERCEEEEEKRKKVLIDEFDR